MQNNYSLARKTKETDIKLALTLYGSGKSSIDTGIGFFNHMLDSLTKHSLMDIELLCKGDTHIDFHHSVEDCGIVLGEVIKNVLYPLENVERFGDASVVMDEACTECVIDLCNRAYLVFDTREVSFCGKVGDFDVELVEEFFKALAFNANISAHIVVKRGTNSHHIAESIFKSFALAFRRAIKKNEKAFIPSTKGVL